MELSEDKIRALIKYFEKKTSSIEFSRGRGVGGVLNGRTYQWPEYIVRAAVKFAKTKEGLKRSITEIVNALNSFPLGSTVSSVSVYDIDDVKFKGDFNPDLMRSIMQNLSQRNGKLTITIFARRDDGDQLAELSFDLKK